MHPCVAWGLGVLGFRVLAPLHVRAIWKAVAMLWACDPDIQIDIKAVSHNNPWVSELNIQSEALSNKLDDFYAHKNRAIRGFVGLCNCSLRVAIAIYFEKALPRVTNVP